MTCYYGLCHVSMYLCCSSRTGFIKKTSEPLSPDQKEILLVVVVVTAEGSAKPWQQPSSCAVRDNLCASELGQKPTIGDTHDDPDGIVQVNVEIEVLAHSSDISFLHTEVQKCFYHHGQRLYQLHATHTAPTTDNLSVLIDMSSDSHNTDCEVNTAGSEYNFEIF